MEWQIAIICIVVSGAACYLVYRLGIKADKASCGSGCKCPEKPSLPSGNHGGSQSLIDVKQITSRLPGSK